MNQISKDIFFLLAFWGNSKGQAFQAISDINSRFRFRYSVSSGPQIELIIELTDQSLNREITYLFV